ncbi:MULTISPECIES: DUF2213 domain-containing protein [unclassified Burkholderia]|uniref:DUF2213 domain-containing protein n=1 Tax=unclassified Burkholderia TaxID=2613784 RepID=UPI000F569BD5|nr:MULTISPECIES: DUF2213 domain-containing protein [unclassified Burkholderia]RQR87718.1 DUF2213 domain-containing protein [Burkholderia sp. Bp9011]RQR97061.1 DUF2213 domain-containing protein [Burkholderia sp. Bp9010]
MTCQCDSCKTQRTNDAVTGSGFFAVEQLGPKQSFTPEGYLLCEEVPIARTGMQDYAEMELDGIEAKDGVIEVERNEDEVFSPDTIASFLGKPVTLNHPSDPVTPDTWAYLAKGTAHNIRRGEGDQSNLLIADLLITDKGAINEIRNNGLKEISCGYDAAYEQIAPGRARQTSIVGNHVALVKSARCGPVCSVQDSKELLGESLMAKKVATSLADKMRKLFMTRDSEGFEKALEEVKDEDGSVENTPAIHIHMPGSEKANASEDTKDEESEGNPAEQKIMAAIEGLTQAVAAIGERVSKLESGSTNDSEEEKKDKETKDEGGTEEESEETMDSDEEEGKDDEKKSTSDSASFRDEFQDAKARAEILAPGVSLPTYDAKADSKKTSDALCVLRRRALKAALTNDNGDLVRMITGDADVSKMDCAAAKMAFHAASELVKQKNKTAKTSTADSQAPVKKDLNQIHADFWAKRK